jgi:hypothetical protein
MSVSLSFLVVVPLAVSLRQVETFVQAGSGLHTQEVTQALEVD